MCGRFAQLLGLAEYEDYFDIRERPKLNVPARYNIAPTNQALIVRPGERGRMLERRHWGLIPVWSKTGKMDYATFNARTDGVREKATFKTAFAKRRCIVPADGFYEWTGPKTDRTPHFFTRADGNPLALAGLYETWKSKDEKEVVESFTIVVGEASEWMNKYHDRQPVILEPDDFDVWMSGTADEAAALMKPAGDGVLQERVVSKLVNKTGNDGPELLDPAAA